MAAMLATRRRLAILAAVAAQPGIDVANASLLGRAVRDESGPRDRPHRRLAGLAGALRPRLSRPLPVPRRLPAGAGDGRSPRARDRPRLRHRGRAAWPAQAPTTTGVDIAAGPGGDGARPAASVSRRAARAGAAGLGARAALPGRLLRPRRLHRLPAPHGRPGARGGRGAARAAAGRRAAADGLQPPLGAARAAVAAARRAPPAGGRRADARGVAAARQRRHPGRRRGRRTPTS